jgi:hypothetical protein
MAGSVTRNRISTTILSLYKLIPKPKSLGNVEEIHSSAPAAADFSCVRLQPRLPLTSKIQRSVVSKHPESYDPTNCVASEDPRIAIFVPNSVLNGLWIPRFRPSGRCIHARLLNVLNCVKRTAHPRPHNGWDGLNCTPEGSQKQIKICRGGRRAKPKRSPSPDQVCLSRDIAP